MLLRWLLRPPVLLLAVSSLAAAAYQQWSAEAPDSPNAPSQSGHFEDLRSLPPPHQEAAAAARRGDFTEAQLLLSSLPDEDARASALTRLLLGLYAQQANDSSVAIEHLSAAVRTVPALEDWRLLSLAAAAHEADEPAAAREAIVLLLTEHKQSVLRPRAMVMAAETALETGDPHQVLRWVDLGRNSSLDRESRRELELLGWEASQSLEQPGIRQEVARRLLIEHPAAAAELQVMTAYQVEGDQPGLAEILSPEDFLSRARRLLDDSMAAAAQETLISYPESERDLAWGLLQAEALTRSYRGLEALAVLEVHRPVDEKQQSALVWQQALAARDASRARRGRTNLPQTRRQSMRDASLRYLEQLVDLEGTSPLALEAQRLLVSELFDKEEIEAAIELLPQLLQIDPQDTTGARPLWRLGWREYSRRNLTGAIGYWSELESLYPISRYARSGYYWSGRSHERLGNSGRAESIYRQIMAADTSDFYRRHAEVRLQGTVDTELPPTPEQPQEPWPEDPLLARTRYLSDLGLDEMALIELDALEQQASPQAYHALRSVVLSRAGERRQSIHHLAKAFPALGTPHQAAVPADAKQLYYPLDFRQLIEVQAAERHLSPSLVSAMIRQESAFDAAAGSRAGARGLMQIMPATGRELAARLGLRYSLDRLSDPQFSIQLGTSYFRQVLDMFDGNEQLALAGYNGGPYRIKRLWRQAGGNAELDTFLEGLQLEETKTYVKRILLFTDSYDKLYGQGG